MVQALCAGLKNIINAKIFFNLTVIGCFESKYA